MSPLPATSPLPEIVELLARQSHAIDSGDGTGWADTFTEDGVFASPSYPEPVRGRPALTEFATTFAPANPRGHHLVLGTFVESGDADAVTAVSTLMITRSDDDHVTIVRTCTLRDRFVATGAGWRLHHREVSVH